MGQEMKEKKNSTEESCQCGEGYHEHSCDCSGGTEESTCGHGFDSHQHSCGCSEEDHGEGCTCPDCEEKRVHQGIGDKDFSRLSGKEREALQRGEVSFTSVHSREQEKKKHLKGDELLRYRDLEIFNGVETENLNALLYCMKSYVRSYKKGEIVHLEEKNEQHVGVVLQGSIHMLKTDVWGNETLLTYMNEGEIFGETFGNNTAAGEYVSFVAASKAEVLFISFQKAIHVCKNRCAFHFRLIENLFDLIGKKNIQLMEKIEVTSRSSLREKILAYLSLQAQKQKSKYIELGLSRTDMAQFLCTNRSAMTRELSQLKEEGIIDFDRNTFILKQ